MGPQINETVKCREVMRIEKGRWVDHRVKEISIASCLITDFFILTK